MQAAHAQPCLPPPSGLVGWWPGDGNADDIADGNPGALIGGTAFAAGKVGQAFSLDGSNDFINVPGLSAPTDKTYSLWVKVDATPGSFNTLIEFGNDAPWFGLVQSGAVELFPNNPETPTTITPGVFTHIAYTSDSGTNKGKIYINGVQNGADGIANTATTTGMGIGFHSGDTHFDGLIDEVAIFDRALSATEILAIVNADSSGMCKGDAVPPDTTIDSMPTDPTNDNTPTFGFSGTDADSGVASFECDLDGGGFTACSSTKTLAALGDGSHTFQVRAIDNAGNTDPTPASYTWVTDATPPDTTIDSKVDGNGIDLSDMTTVSTGAEFTFSGTDATSGVASFECNINSTGWVVCTSSKVYAGLSPGNNTFEVRAIDNAGNTDPTPAIFAWTIQTPGAASDELIQDIKDLGFDKKIEKSLIGPLKKVSKILDDGNPDNDQAACDKLTEFLDNLAAKADKIDDAGLVDALEADAQGIKDAIGCPLI